jgi:hypothetical protein
MSRWPSAYFAQTGKLKIVGRVQQMLALALTNKDGKA